MDNVRTRRKILCVDVYVPTVSDGESRVYSVSCVINLPNPEEDTRYLGFETRSVTVDPLETISRRPFDRIYLPFVSEEGCKKISNACRVKWRVPGKWFAALERIDLSKRRHLEELRDKFSADHSFDWNFREIIKEACEKVWAKAQLMLDGLMSDAASRMNNAALRSKYRRSRVCYLDPMGVIYDLFPGRFSTEDGLREPCVRWNKAVFPHFLYSVPCDENWNKLPYHEEGMSSVLISFGADPVRYAVILVSDMKMLFGSSSMNLCAMNDPRLYAVAWIEDEMVIKPINVSYEAPEEQLELAVLMAFGDSISSKRPS